MQYGVIDCGNIIIFYCLEWYVILMIDDNNIQYDGWY